LNHFKLSLLIALLVPGTNVFAQSGTGVITAPAPVIDAKSLDRGQLDGVNYRNTYFGLSLSVPPTWIVVSAERTKAIVEETGKVVTADQKKKAQIDASMERSALLLSLTKVPAGQPNNAAFMLIAERMPSSSVKTGVDVVELMKKTFTGTNFNIEFQGDIQTERIGGADFAVATVKNTSPSGTFMQKIYVTTKNGYALELFYTYTDEADLAAYNSIVNTMKIN
jgi:hypothetical protein